MNDKVNPYKGVPRSQWGMVKEQLQRAKEAPMTPEVPTFIAQAPEVAEPQAPEPKAEEAPRVNSEPLPSAPPRSLFSGQFMALEVFGKSGDNKDPIPGWHLHWFTDMGDRINRARLSGYEFVNKDEIALQENLVPGNNDLGTQVRKVMNSNLTPPTYGYLMKIPKATWEAQQAELQKVNDRAEAALRKGQHNAQPGDGRYVAGDIPGSALPKIEISPKTYRPS